MKRMIPTKFINWVKKLFGAIQPGAKEGDVEIGGNLEVDGNVKWNTPIRLNWDFIPFYDDGGVFLTPLIELSSKLIIGVDQDLYGGDFGLTVYSFDDSKQVAKRATVLSPLGLWAFDANFEDKYTLIQLDVGDPGIMLIGDHETQTISITGKVKMNNTEMVLGSTALTEEQLKKLIALIPAESGE